jgi:hypothetical protein
MSKPIPAVDGNALIGNRIVSGDPFIATKIGAVERTVILENMIAGHYSDRVRFYASNNAGITPSDDDTLNLFCNEYTKSLSNADYVGSMESAEELAIIQHHAANATFSELRFLEPFYFDDPWSGQLEDKNVLVVHPFEDSLIKQYAQREALFANPKVLPKFNLLTIKAEQTNGGGMAGESMTFVDALGIMIDKMDNIDYDIALLGCGAYGLILAGHAKTNGKQAIHIGGGLQILFGIKGQRWDVHPEISAMFNEHWCRPLLEERTTHYEMIEGGTYW